MIHKKVILSILIICFICAATTGTWASISSEQKSDRSIVSTGKIVLNLDDGSDWHFSSPPILPGESTTSSFTVTNTGNRKGYLFIQPVISGVPLGLVNNLKVKIVGTDDNDENGELLFTVENAYPNPSVISVGELVPSDVYTITVTCSILQGSTYNPTNPMPFNIKMECKLNQHNNIQNKKL